MGIASNAPGEAIDPLSGDTFDRIYAAAIEPELKIQEVYRRQGAALFMGTAAVAVVLDAILWLAAPDGRAGGLFILLGALLTGLSYLPLAFVASETKQKVVSALCAPLGVTFEAVLYDPPDLERLHVLKLLPPSDEGSFEDRFRGRRAGCAFELFEASLDSGSGRDQKTVFTGQIFMVTFPRRFLGDTVLYQDSGWLNGAQRPKAMQKVSLEDSVFERAYEVFSTDQVEARAILTPDFIERLAALRTQFAAQNLRCAFSGGQVLIAIESPNRFEVGSMFATLVDQRRMEGIARDLSAVFRLIDSFVAARAFTPTTSGG
jgi:hypothetical protein